jgi:hypothetical protein
MGTAAMAPLSIIDQPGDMIIDDEAGETDLLQGAHDGSDIEIAFPQKAFLKVGDGALHVTQMHIEDLALFAEMA